MPKAIANTAERIRHDLKALPGGFVEARRLSYGEKIVRRSMVSSMRVEMQGKKSKNSDMTAEMQLMNEQSTVYDFQHCILDHNLFKDDAETVKLNFQNINDIRALDPRVGEEIDTFLSELNNFEDEDEEGNSEPASEPQSSFPEETAN